MQSFWRGGTPRKVTAKLDHPGVHFQAWDYQGIGQTGNAGDNDLRYRCRRKDLRNWADQRVSWIRPERIRSLRLKPPLPRSAEL